MDVILIPGFWLDGSSWRRVSNLFAANGYTVHPLTLPGLEARQADRTGIGLRDHIAAVVAEIDRLAPGKGGPRRPLRRGCRRARCRRRPPRACGTRRLRRQRTPGGRRGHQPGASPVGGEVPLPDWSEFEPEDLVDLDDELRSQFRAIAIPVPARVASDPIEVADERRFDVPISVICSEFRAAQIEEWVAAGVPFTDELARVRDRVLVDLPTGHWPQPTRPDDLATVVLREVRRA